MHVPFRRIVVTAGAAIAFSTVSAIPTDGQTIDATERFTAVAVRMVNSRHTESAVIEVVVNRWFTDDECDMMIGALLDRGPDALREELREAPPVGLIRTADGATYNVVLAEDLPAPHGRRIVLATDRPINLWGGATQSTESLTLIDLRVNRKGEGEGEMLIAVKMPGNDELEKNARPIYELEAVPLVVFPHVEP